jgi:hypothetical protein
MHLRHVLLMHLCASDLSMHVLVGIQRLLLQSLDLLQLLLEELLLQSLLLRLLLCLLLNASFHGADPLLSFDLPLESLLLRLVQLLSELVVLHLLRRDGALLHRRGAPTPLLQKHKGADRRPRHPFEEHGHRDPLLL